MCRHFLPLLLLCFSSIALWAQSDCILMANGISTDPDNPVNPQCTGNEFLNTFDWRAQQYPHGPGGNGEILSPFFNDAATKLSYLWNPLAFPLSAQDFEVEDGWELIRFKPGEDTYVILYNKYTSILRVLFLIPPSQEDYDGISAELKFFPEVNDSGDGVISALLHPTSGLSQPLDKPSISSTKSVVTYSNDGDIFMHIDIPVEYDPCSCLGSGSNLVMEFNKIDSMRLDLYGRSINIERSLANISNGVGTINEDFLTQTYLSNGYQETAGAHTFNTWNDLVLHYADLKEEQAALKKKYEFYKLFGELTKLVKGTSILKGIKLDGTLFPDTTTVVVNPDSSYIDTTGFDFKVDGNGILDFIAGGIGLLGAPIKSKLDAVSGRVNLIGATNFSHGEMTLSGSIVDNSPVGSGISFSNPGSASANLCDDNLPQLYPRYNEILGRFALLETPVAKIKIGTVLPATGGCVDNIYRIQLDQNSVKYVFNPAADILEEETEVQASLQFTTSVACPSNGEPITGSENLILIEQVGNNTVYSTPLLPIECIGEYISGLSISNGGPEAFDVKLTIVVEFVFAGINSDGESPRAIQFYNYPVNLQQDGPVDYAPSSEFYDSFTPKYPYRDTINSTNFTTSQTIFAWSSIYINGALTADPGVQVDIISPRIHVASNTFIGSAIDLYNDVTPFSCEPSLPLTPADVLSFCDSHRYQANNANALREEDSPSDAIEASTSRLKLANDHHPGEVSVYPNPVNNEQASFVLLNQTTETISAMVLDINGRLVSTLFTDRELESGRHVFDLPIGGLRAGTYILKIQGKGGISTERFLKY